MTHQTYTLNEALKVLKAFHNAGYKSAILAGGAIRDFRLGKPIKDYDIFIWDPTTSNEKVPSSPQVDINDTKFIKTIFANAGLTLGGVSVLYTSDYGDIVTDHAGGKALLTNTAKLSGVWECQPPCSLPYQIVMTYKNPVDYVNDDFDVGLCKAYCDGTRLHYTNDFLTDSKEKTLTILGRDMSDAEFTKALLVHVPRLLKKFIGYKVIIAPHNILHIFS